MQFGCSGSYARRLVPAQVGVGWHRLAPGRLDDFEPERTLGGAEQQIALALLQLPGVETLSDRLGAAHPKPLPARELQIGADVRGKGEDLRRQLGRRALRVEAALAGLDLLGVGDPGLVLLGELELPGGLQV